MGQRQSCFTVSQNRPMCLYLRITFIHRLKGVIKLCLLTLLIPFMSVTLYTNIRVCPSQCLSTRNSYTDPDFRGQRPLSFCLGTSTLKQSNSTMGWADFQFTKVKPAPSQSFNCTPTNLVLNL